ncbi:GNAT family N-acetyltransferase [Aureimonas pseudogalii]|nr:GNAT family N-acetyltransferase [Aureimonas pseudogalii]
MQIGWRLLPEAHGVGLATEGARACLRHAFERLDLPELVSYCVVENRASEAVMRRIGMRLAGRFDHPSVDPQTHPHLVRHTLTRITAEEWHAANG